MNDEIRKGSGISTLWTYLIYFVVLFTGCAADLSSKQNNDMEKPPELKIINDISFTENLESIDIRVTGNRVLNYSSVKTPFPGSVVLYFQYIPLKTVF